MMWELSGTREKERNIMKRRSFFSLLLAGPAAAWAESRHPLPYRCRVCRKAVPASSHYAVFPSKGGKTFSIECDPCAIKEGHACWSNQLGATTCGHCNEPITAGAPRFYREQSVGFPMPLHVAECPKCRKNRDISKAALAALARTSNQDKPPCLICGSMAHYWPPDIPRPCLECGEQIQRISMRGHLAGRHGKTLESYARSHGVNPCALINTNLLIEKPMQPIGISTERLEREVMRRI